MLPEIASNLTFGGLQRNHLFITATSTLYSLRLTSPESETSWSARCRHTGMPMGKRYEPGPRPGRPARGRVNAPWPASVTSLGSPIDSPFRTRWHGILLIGGPRDHRLRPERGGATPVVDGIGAPREVVGSGAEVERISRESLRSAGTTCLGVSGSGADVVDAQHPGGMVGLVVRPQAMRRN